ncbi:zinc ribbon domain-containing protein [Paenibacillus sp. DMB20]|uniref:zinc ribbon domain-containing protein n=1 Tax=Paenibacillus sp. DMB20 TaxID=1642570 RepID=UPI000627EC21|nr:zinc ribbon domain-containing protein [Paenibacillus sp. DMB20]KKO51290.1 hypothetical protein XI25_27385 [Paenibacillus sp. DMB20]
MSFMDKFKAGVAEAGSKAKTMVEINKLKLQNSGKKNEMNEQFQEIGKVVFEAVESGMWPPERERLETYIEQLSRLKWEIEQNELQIKNLTDVKTCKSCGQQAAIQDRYCSVCGYTFEIVQEPEVRAIELGEGSPD